MKDIAFRYHPETTPRPLRPALQLIAEDFPLRALASPARANVRFDLRGPGPRLEKRDSQFVVSGTTVPQVLRALATLRGFAETSRTPRMHAEPVHFDTHGLMLDASRNAVSTVATVKLLLRRMALMGMNLLMLYTEDTYEVPAQPYLGYLRGRYTQAELRELDAYAAKLGIEMIPCVQALAHLAQMLRWPAFGEVCDTQDILLAGEPKTYRLLEQMISAARAPYRSRRIHIGMDEAHNLGLGKYLDRHGFRPRFEIMNGHLRRVVAITNRLGLRPMIWSDMYFRLGCKSGDYYDPKTNIPASAARSIPRSVDLVYWDYYHAEKEFYIDWIDRHRALGKEPIFAPGVWTWGTFVTNFNKARLCTDAGMLACKERGVREAFTTVWGDDGTEVDMLGMLPCLQHFAEHGYSETVTDAALARQFAGTTGGDFQTAILPRKLDETPFVWPMLDHYRKHKKRVTRYVARIPKEHMANWCCSAPSKFLLWQDPLLGLYDKQIEGIPLGRYYRGLAAELRAAIQRHPSDTARLLMPLRLAEVMEDKAELGVRILRAYRRGDHKTLAHIRGRVIPRLLQRVAGLHEAHRALWFSLYKPHGWEVLDVRYGGLAARLRATQMRLDDCVRGRCDSLAELEDGRLPVSGEPWPKGKLGWAHASYRRTFTPSMLT